LSIVLAIPDTHAPFMNPGAVDFLSDLKKEYRPNVIVHLGDEGDQHALGDWDPDPDGMSPGDEHKAMVAQLKSLYKLFPNVHVCTSNHGERPFKRAFKSGIPKAYLKAYREFMEAPDEWRWSADWIFDGVVYEHGEGHTGKDGALKAALGNRKSTVIGHIHSFAGVQYSATKFDQIFGFNVGWLGDEQKYAFRYGLKFKNKPVLGAGIIIEGREAIFRPMNNGR
jgi:hypothetical protein